MKIHVLIGLLAVIGAEHVVDGGTPSLNPTPKNSPQRRAPDGGSRKPMSCSPCNPKVAEACSGRGSRKSTLCSPCHRPTMAAVGGRRGEAHRPRAVGAAGLCFCWRQRGGGGFSPSRLGPQPLPDRRQHGMRIRVRGRGLCRDRVRGWRRPHDEIGDGDVARGARRLRRAVRCHARLQSLYGRTRQYLGQVHLFQRVPAPARRGGNRRAPIARLPRRRLHPGRLHRGRGGGSAAAPVKPFNPGSPWSCPTGCRFPRG